MFEARFRLGMFDSDCVYDSIPINVIECRKHRELNRKMAQESIVLLKNNGILPLNPEKTIAVIGPNADDKTVLLGNYSGTPSHWTTLLRGIQEQARGEVYYARGSVLVEKEALPWAEKPLHEAIYTAKAADVVVLCLGLSPLLEGEEGDAYNGADSGDRKDISLPDIQQQLLCAILDTEKPVVLVNVSGGCVDLRQADERCAAILQCFYPGAEGGNALADILFGRVSPSGRLPVTFYRTVEDLPPFTDYSMKGRTYRFFDGKPLYPFGHGLTYADIKEQWTDPYTVRVKNASETATGYSILRYENRALADFKHIWLDGHTETEVRFLQENENKRQTRSAHSCKEK